MSPASNPKVAFSSWMICGGEKKGLKTAKVIKRKQTGFDAPRNARDKRTEVEKRMGTFMHQEKWAERECAKKNVEEGVEMRKRQEGRKTDRDRPEN